jgi:hypothetical protein
MQGVVARCHKRRMKPARLHVVKTVRVGDSEGQDCLTKWGWSETDGSCVFVVGGRLRNAGIGS